jgi:hypothetical protein
VGLGMARGDLVCCTYGANYVRSLGGRFALLRMTSRKLATVFLQEHFHVQSCTYFGLTFDLSPSERRIYEQAAGPRRRIEQADWRST